MISFKPIKLVITLFFLSISCFVIFNIFKLNYNHYNLKFSVDSWNEEQILIILHSTWMSMLAVLCLGILSIWINFIFFRITYNQEIKEAAMFLLKIRNKQQSKSKIYPIDIYMMNEKKNNKWYNKLFKTHKI